MTEPRAWTRGVRNSRTAERGVLGGLLLGLTLAVLGGIPAAASGQTDAGLLPGVPEPSTETPPAAEPAPSQDAEPPPPARDERLSDERQRSQWAYVASAVWARAEPRRGARRVKRLRRRVPDTGSRELVLLLRQRTLANGSVWVHVRLPMRPNNRTGWVPRRSLGGFRTAKGRLVVHRRAFRASLFDARGRRVWTARVGVGQRRWPTPRGRFYIRERLIVPRGRARAVYGPFAFGTSAHAATLRGGNWGEGVVGIHGTGSPHLIPGRISHGCVRVRNRAIQRLRRLMPLGTPVRIR